jgi:AmiR/NasT family two-component response regulator
MSDSADGLRVLVADEDQEALDQLSHILDSLEHDVIARAIRMEEVSREIAGEQPDIALVKLHGDTDHALDLIDEIVADSTCPVIALMEVEKPEFVRKAAAAGIYAYVQPVTQETVQGAIEVAVRRHAEREELEDVVDELEGALDRRAVIERAKGILMERHGINAGESFEMLRRHARNNGRKLVDVARSVIEGQALLPKG